MVAIGKVVNKLVSVLQASTAIADHASKLSPPPIQQKVPNDKIIRFKSKGLLLYREPIISHLIRL